MNQIDFLDNFHSILPSPESKQIFENPLLKQDIWSTKDLGLKIREHNRCLTLNFNELSQDWFKFLVKLYVLLRALRKISLGTIQNEIQKFRQFSRFMKQYSINNIEEINEQLFDSFNEYLLFQKLKKNTITGYYIALSNFFNICRGEGWLEVNTFWFQGRLIRFRPNNDEVDYIPEDVWNQLDQNLNKLPEPIQRMVLLIRTTGMRIGELLNLPFDCLRRRGKQWCLRLTTEKYDIEDELPICPELVSVIREQQNYIKENLGAIYDKLFCSNGGHGISDFYPKPKVMSGESFNKWLNRLSGDCNICAKGKTEPWKFKSHQFRKTVATIMTNNGIRDLIIQKYLRHRSLDMQNYYKHLLKQVLEAEYEELMREKKYIDISGHIVATYKPDNPVTELMRRKMHSITTIYGECHRPILKNPCEIVNACLHCQHLHISIDDLPFLKQDLKRVESELEIAKKLGMIRQQQGLESDYKRLITLIQLLETSND
ncbi:hypothetical protein CAL7716_088870 [Calothrix sp. PCC 7716]|nr:hypothetical protein CAL7716_042140 [Calothrix sp. PCC 7716]BDA74721.1 hypothetical protein CAL7716_088870 [Calothrix sp. PCC 7716]